MDTRTGEIKPLEDWTKELGREEVQRRIKSERLIVRPLEELQRRSKLLHLRHGTKNQQKKYRQLTRKNRDKRK